jgi:hypothetical protein
VPDEGVRTTLLDTFEPQTTRGMAEHRRSEKILKSARRCTPGGMFGSSLLVTYTKTINEVSRYVASKRDSPRCDGLTFREFNSEPVPPVLSKREEDGKLGLPTVVSMVRALVASHSVPRL